MGGDNLGRKMSRISNLGGGKFGVENAISNLEFGGVENFPRKMLSRISTLGGGDSIWGGKFLSPKSRDLGGGKFGAENFYLPNLEIWGGGWKILGWKIAISQISRFGGWQIWGGKCYLESRKLGGGEAFGAENAPSPKYRDLGGGKFGTENAISNLPIFGVENLGMESAISILEFSTPPPNLGIEICTIHPKFSTPKIGRVEIAFGVENAISNLEFGGWR